MNKWLLRLLYAAPVLLVGGLSWADYLATQGAGTTVFAFVCSATKVCPASVLINSANTEIATATNPLRTDPTGGTTQPVSGTVTAVQATGTNLHMVCDSGCAAGATPSNYGTSPGAIAVAAVNAFVTNSLVPGRNTAANSSPVVPVAAASTAGAIVPNNTTAVVVKASAGTLFGVQVYGINAAPAYLKIYNAASATCGSGTPVKRLMIPAAATPANGAGSNVTFGSGLAFGTGITYCVTTGIADADTTAPTAANFLVNVDYE